jgi:hypothetical protein
MMTAATIRSVQRKNGEFMMVLVCLKVRKNTKA